MWTFANATERIQFLRHLIREEIVAYYKGSAYHGLGRIPYRSHRRTYLAVRQSRLPCLNGTMQSVNGMPLQISYFEIPLCHYNRLLSKLLFLGIANSHWWEYKHNAETDIVSQSLKNSFVHPKLKAKEAYLLQRIQAYANPSYEKHIRQLML